MSKPVEAKDVLNPGREIVASGYCIYGTSTQLYLALANKVNGFTLDLTIGEFVLTHKNVHIKKHAPIYSINEGNTKKWPAPVKNYIESVKFPSEGPSFSLRYIGSMVADVHRTLLYGGIFIYPQDSSSPNGKLRLLYECAPLSFLVVCAGGHATTGTQPVLDVVPTELHQRIPIALGSLLDVQRYEAFFNTN
jgi:fructose-1,6-bisphosphatase I